MGLEYKETQKKYRQQAKKVVVLHSGRETINLGIQEFKRNNKDSYMRKTFKENAWNSFLTSKEKKAKEVKKNLKKQG